ncbi:helix-turn-helix domain-containing protein [Bacillus sp. 03113]|uniref:helix-turn-helix domain-containing protein n=1 Tax=Bacillus sp. 03113 TaxID=2578211 RepID=UPI0011412859|nr:helix-turn-helix domain-containing protein [Bacillus sp. 03113]
MVSFEQANPFRRDSYDSLESFVDHISEVLGCPITLEDTHHRLLAYSSHDEETDSARILTIIRRRVPEKVINRLWKDGIIPQLLKSKEPLRIEERSTIGLGNRVAISIWRGDEVLGYIWAIEMENPLSETALQLLCQAALTARHLLLRYGKNKSYMTSDNQEFFWKLLTGHLTDQNAVKEKLQDVGLSMPPSFAVAVFEFAETISKDLDKQISYLLKTTEKVKAPFYTVDDKDLIILACLEDNEIKAMETYKSFVSTFQKHMADRFGVFHIKAGIGGIYHLFNYVVKSYKEARTVLEVQEKFPAESSHFISYQDLGIYQFLDLLLEKRQKDGFDNIAIQNLANYDRKHHTELLQTLEVFLDENESMQKTSASLHIHGNTLAYRLKRISDIMEVDLTQPNQKFMLYLDLKLLKWKKK